MEFIGTVIECRHRRVIGIVGTVGGLPIGSVIVRVPRPDGEYLLFELPNDDNDFECGDTVRFTVERWK